MGWTSSMSIPKSFDEALEYFAGRRDKALYSRPLGNNTSVVCINASMMAIRLHATDIIVYHKDGRVMVDNYDSAVTNDRRDNAGMPTIHSANAASVPARQVGKLAERRRWVVRGLGYTLPADRPLYLNSDRTVADLDEFTETVYLKNPERQREYKRAMKWARDVVAVTANSMQQLGAWGEEFCRWRVSASDLLNSYRAWVEMPAEQRIDHVVEFINRSIEKTGFVRLPGNYQLIESMGREIATITPSALASKELWEIVPDLWVKKIVHPSEIAEL